MMHQALYRKWRPKSFEGVYGQDHVTSVLRHEVAGGKISHAYLFCGSRGTGKTSCAKILAKAVNCESPKNGEPCGKCTACRMIDDGTATDVLELDAASNNGVENVRDIRDEVIYSPAVLKRRVYIIDEVHMLSVAAFNALLKTLEEPPEHVVFILATTEPQKLPATIISRCQRFDFKRIDNKSIVDYLTKIAEAEGIGLDAGAAALIARLSQGGMRDAISTLELCAGDGARVTEEVVRSVAGVAGRGLLVKTVAAVRDRDTEAIFAVVEELYSSSLDIAVFWAELVAFYRDMLVISVTKNPGAYLELTASELEETAALARRFTREALAAQSEIADDALVRMSRAGSQKRLIAELTLIRMSDPRLGGDLASLTERVAALEEAAARGNIPVPTVKSGTPDESDIASPESGTAKPDESDIASPENVDTESDDGDMRPPFDTASEPAAAEPAKPELKAAAKRSVPASGQTAPAHAEPKSRIPYLRWADAVEKYSAVKGGEGIAGFLELAEAYRDGESFVITADSAAMLAFIDNDDVRTRLAEIISALEGCNIEPSAIYVEAAKRDAERQPMDDFTL